MALLARALGCGFFTSQAEEEEEEQVERSRKEVELEEELTGPIGAVGCHCQGREGVVLFAVCRISNVVCVLVQIAKCLSGRGCQDCRERKREAELTMAD